MLFRSNRTGIDLTGESAGILPSQEWKLKRFRQKWYAGETISVGIGQGYNSYTPLQLAQAMATIANDGVMFRPHIINYIEDIVTRNRAVVEPQPLRTIDLKPEHLKTVKDALIGVNREGTGARLRRRAVHERGQDRHGAGDRDQAGREIRRKPRCRTASRSRAVRRLCAGRQTADRYRGGG